MLYLHSYTIENRLQSVLQLVKTGDYLTPEWAETLVVSIPTTSRDVTSLRERGHNIRSVQDDQGWRYVLSS